MKHASSHRKSLAALLLVPALALAVVAAQGLAGWSAAEAQQSRSPNGGGIPGDNGGADPTGAKQRPCPPGTAAVAAFDCTPWTPPRRVAASKEDCSCEITYKLVDGRRVATRDCYVLLPDNRVHYCQNPRLLR